MNLRDSQKGFTLIEILVSAFILVLVVVAASQMYVTASSAQRRAYGKQNALDASRYALEYMGRAVRQSTIRVISNNQIHIHHPDSTKCGNLATPCSVYYRINSSRIQESIVAKDNAAGGWQDITSSSNVQVESLRFTGYTQDNGNDIHPRVTISMTIRPILDKDNEESSVRIQTTLTSRDPRWESTP